MTGRSKSKGDPRRHKRDRADRIRTVTRKAQAHPIVAALLLLGGLAGFAMPAASAVQSSVNYIHGQLFWRGQAEQQLKSLYVGMSIETLRETFGTPVVTDVAGEGFGGPLDESVFEGHDGDFYVQALTDRSGSVERFVVTSCTDGFRPTLGPADLDVTLYEDMLETAPTVEKDTVHYQVPASNHPEFFQWLPGFGATGFIAYGSGFTGVCGDPWRNKAEQQEFYGALEKAGYYYEDATPEQIARLFQTIRVNSYMECKSDCEYVTSYGPEKDELAASKRDTD